MKEIIDRWGAEDDIDMSGVTFDYEDLGDRTMGITRFKWRESLKGADIRVSYRLKGSMSLYGVLWHEYSHFYEWVTYGTAGHGVNWLRS